MAKNYIDNKKLLAAFTEHREKTQKARAEGREDPMLPDYIGRCFLLLADNLGKKYNFSGYSYLDEMRDDAIENAIVAANNFDPTKSSNPFGYFTKIMWFAFLRRIDKEKKQTVIKYSLMQKMATEGSLFNGEEIKGLDIKVDNEFMDAAVNDFEEKKKKKDEKSKATKAKKGVEEFFDTDGDKTTD